MGAYKSKGDNRDTGGTKAPSKAEQRRAEATRRAEFNRNNDVPF